MSYFRNRGSCYNKRPVFRRLENVMAISIHVHTSYLKEHCYSQSNAPQEMSQYANQNPFFGPALRLLLMAQFMHTTCSMSIGSGMPAVRIAAPSLELLELLVVVVDVVHCARAYGMNAIAKATRWIIDNLIFSLNGRYVRSKKGFWLAYWDISCGALDCE